MKWREAEVWGINLSRKSKFFYFLILLKNLSSRICLKNIATTSKISYSKKTPAMKFNSYIDWLSVFLYTGLLNKGQKKKNLMKSL